MEEQPYAGETAKKEELGNELRVAVSESGSYSIDGVTLSSDALAKRIARQVERDASKPVMIHANAQAQLNHVLELMEMLKAAGVTSISIAAPAD